MEINQPINSFGWDPIVGSGHTIEYFCSAIELNDTMEWFLSGHNVQLIPRKSQNTAPLYHGFNTN